MSEFILIKEIAVIDRQRKQMKNISELAESIKEVGRLINPITVRRADPETDTDKGWKGEPYVLKTGGRRLAAHMVLGKAEIEANVWDECPPLMREIIELRENVDRENITWQEEISAKERIHALRLLMNPEHTAKATAHELGESKANISKDLHLARLMKADPTLKDSPTKKAALRKAEFKATIDRRVAAIKGSDVTLLKEKLVVADMRDFIRTLEDDSIDLVFPDFPFGIDYDQARDANQKGAYRDAPRSLFDLLYDIVPEIVRVLKPTGWAACMMGWTNYQLLERLFIGACKTHGGYANVIYNDDKERWERKENKCADAKNNPGSCVFLQPEPIPWVWYRPNSRQPSLWPELHANNQFELICVVNGGQARLVTPNVGNVLAIDADYKDRIHEMQRPHELCVEIIKRLTVTGEKVLDLCFGSGAHLAAAADLGRDFLGCDMNPDNLGPALSLVSQYHNKPKV